MALSQVTEWTPVYGSSNVEAIAYLEETKECHVRFLGGAHYVYHDVTPKIWEEFLQAPSKGRYVNIVLKRGYKFDALAHGDRHGIKDRGGRVGGVEGVPDTGLRGRTVGPRNPPEEKLVSGEGPPKE